ncbi:MAG: fibronectin type III domain-containing protein [Elusimicrobiales bacterium]|jgi:hypothetical protein
MRFWKNEKKARGLRGVAPRVLVFPVRRPSAFRLAVFALLAFSLQPPALLHADTKLYLRDTVSSLSPNGRELTYDKGAAVVTYTKNTVAGAVTPPTGATQFTETAGGAVVAWYSDPLDAVTINGNVTFNIWAKESATAANATITAELLLANNAGVIQSVIASVLIPRAELTTTLKAQNWVKAPASTTLSNGDRLALRIYIDDGNTVKMASGRTVTATLGGGTAGVSGDSWLTVTEDLAPASPAVTAITGVAARQMSASWTLIEGATGYMLGASVSPANPPSPVYASSVTLIQNNAVVGEPALAPDTTYYLFVRSNGYGNSSSWTAYPGTSTLLAYDPVFSGFTNIEPAAVRFEWAANGNADPGTLYRVVASTAPDPLNPGGAVVTASSTYNTYLSSAGLAADTTYYFRVAGMNHNNVPTGYSAPEGTATLLAYDPQFLNFTGVGISSVRFNWSANGNRDPGTFYRVLVSTAPDPSNPDGAVVTSSYTYNLYLSSSGLNADTTYYFRVAGLNQNGVPTAYTAVKGTSTLAEIPVFSDFTGVGASAAQFNWSADGNRSPGTLYSVLVSTAPDPLVPSGAAVTSSDTYNAFLSSSGLSANTTYYFRAAGVNNNGVLTAYTAPRATSTLLAFDPVFTDIMGVTASAMRFEWSANGNRYPGTLYRVLVSTAPDPLAPDGAVVTASDTYNVYLSSSGLAADTVYYSRVAGVNNNDMPTNYAAAQGTSTLLAFAPVFSNFTGMGTSAIQVDWSANGNRYPGTLYRVYSSTAADPLAPAGAVVASSDTYNVFLSSSGLNPNTTYYFSVAGVNGNGVETSYTAAQGTSTLAALPSAFDFTGISSAAIRLDWSASGNGPGTRYRVIVSTSVSGDPLVPAGAVVTTSDTYNLYLSTAGLAADRDYYFRAAAINNNNIAAAYSSIISTKTLAVGVMSAPIVGSLAAYASSITANWSLVSGATGYTLAASVNPGPAPSPVYASSTTAGGAGLSAFVFSPALVPDTAYYLFVRANGAGVASSWADYAPAYTLLSAPPLFLNFSAVGTASAVFNWDANGNTYPGTKFRVLVSTAPDPLSPAGAAVSLSDTYDLSLSSAGLTPDTPYYFRAAGVNKAGVATDYTAAQSTTTWAAVPAFLNFTNVDSGSIRFNWSAGGNPGTLYRVAVSTAPDPLSPAGAVVTTSDTYNVDLSSSGLAADTIYYFRVAALGKNGHITDYTASVGTATLLAAAPVFTNFTDIGTSDIQFNWSAEGNADPGTLYRVLASTAPDPFSPYGAVVVASDTYNTRLNSVGLGRNTTYYFSVAGVNKNGVLTSYTAVKGTSTLAALPLSAVSTFSAVSDSGFTAAWDAASNPSDSSYVVQVSTAPDFNPGAGNQVTASTVPADGGSYAFTGLTFSTTYYFRVRAVNRNGVSTAYAALGSVRTLSLPAPVPYSVDTITENSIAVGWTLVNGATGYTLAASVNSGAEPSPIYASSATKALSAVLSSPALAPNTTYYLFIRADGPGESGAWAAYPAVSTLANPPLSAVSTFSAVTHSGFSVRWDANSNPLGSTRYTVEVSSAPDFNSGATDGISFTTAPAAGPSASFEGLNQDTYYYFRVRAGHNNGNFSDWVYLGNRKTLLLPVIHSAGDGVIIYGQAANAMPQFRNYYGATNSFSQVLNTASGAAGSLFVIKTNPLISKQEALAGYVKDGLLHVLCTDGTNWNEEWTQFVGGNETTRRFDIAYETDTGNAMVLYSHNAAGSDELGYRTKPGDADCGSADWSADTGLDPVRTSGVVQWVKMASDRRSAYGDIAAIWADSNSDLSAMVWNGAAWENEPAAALETSLEVVSAAQDVDDFDVDFESLTGDIMVVWAKSTGANGTNGVRYSAATWTGGSPLHSWGAVATPPSFLDDATNLSLTANPSTNEMIFASLGNAGSDLQAGYWSGTAWTNTANLDTSAGTPLAGTKLVASGWLTSGTAKRGIVAYADSAATNIGWYALNGTAFTAQTDFTPTPVFANPQKRYEIQQDPVNKDRLMFTVSDNNYDLFAKRLIMTAAPAFTWTNADGGSALEASLSSTTVGGYSYAYWPAPPATSFSQSAYRFFGNTDSAAAGAPLAAQDSLAVLAPGAAFRLRTLVHIGQLNLPLSGAGFKLQFAGRGDGTCESPSGGVPSGYTDVTADTLAAFNNNAVPADNVPLTAGADDPQHGAHITAPQTYEEQNNSTNTVSAVPRNRDGMWDFALKDNGMVPGTSYCFRLVKADGSDLNEYEVYPEIMLPSSVYINEIYPSGASAAEDWVELYNNTASTPSLVGWKLDYIENTIDVGGTPNTVWAGGAGDVVNAYSTFTITGLSMNLVGAQSYHLKLLNNAGVIVDQAQWPGPGAVSAGQSFARITDGNPSFFEIDPTPTSGSSNFIDTDTVRINEISYGGLDRESIELYNTSSVSTLSLAGYSFRNAASSANGLKFRFTRKLYPNDYAVIDFSSLSDDALSYSDVFGDQGLTGAGDFLVLENSSGSVVDMAVWQSGNNYSRYNYRGELVSAGNFAQANAAYSIGRRPSEGSDTGNDLADFTASAFVTPASRNNNAGLAAANTLVYPPGSGEPQFLSRKFPVTLALGADSSAGSGNNLLFSRIGGAADPGSPHLYRLQDMGFNLASPDTQTTAQTGLFFYDQEGLPLVSGVSYRMTLNSDNGSASAAPIVLGTVTYGAAVPSVTASAVSPLWMNNASRAGMMKLQLSNNNPAGFGGVEVGTVAFKVLDSDLAALNTAQARGLFNAVMLVRDSTSSGVAGLYEPSIDVSTVAYVPMASISLDAAGRSTLTVVSPGPAADSVPGALTGIFYVVFESTQNASDRSPNVFRVRFAPETEVTVRDSSSWLQQEFTFSPQVDSSSVTLIAPAQPPAGTSWPYALPAAAVTPAQAAYYNNDSGDTSVGSSVYMCSTDGYLRAVRKDGTFKWSYATNPLSAVHNSPNVVVESGSLYIYFADDNGDVYKVRDDEAGAVLVWKQPLGAAVRSNIMCPSLDCSGPRMYFGASDSTVRCLNKADGTPCPGWSFAGAITAPPSGTISIDDRATVNTGWIGLEDGKVVAVHTADGTVPTSYQTGAAIKTSPFLDARDASPNNVLYFTSTDGKLYARVSSNLSNRPAGWPSGDYDAGAPINTSPFITWDAVKYVFFGDDAGRLHKVSAADGASAPGWPFQAGAAIRSSPVWVPGAVSYVYFGCDDGYIYAINADTGVMRSGWPVATGGPVRADIVIDPDNGRLMVGSGDGKTYVLEITP